MEFDIPHDPAQDPERRRNYRRQPSGLIQWVQPLVTLIPKFREYVEWCRCICHTSGLDLTGGLGDNDSLPTLSDEYVSFNIKSKDKDGLGLMSFFLARDTENWPYNSEEDRPKHHFCVITDAPEFHHVVIACLIAAERFGIIYSWTNSSYDRENGEGVQLFNAVKEIMESKDG